MALLLSHPLSMAFMHTAALRSTALAGSALPSCPRPALLPSYRPADAAPSYMLDWAPEAEYTEFSVALALAPALSDLLGRLMTPLLAAALAVACVPLLILRLAPDEVKEGSRRVVQMVRGVCRAVSASTPMRFAVRLLSAVEPLPHSQLSPVELPRPVLTTLTEQEIVEERMRVERKKEQSPGAIYLRQLYVKSAGSSLAARCREQAKHVVLV